MYAVLLWARGSEKGERKGQKSEPGEGGLTFVSVRYHIKEFNIIASLQKESASVNALVLYALLSCSFSDTCHPSAIISPGEIHEFVECCGKCALSEKRGFLG